MTTHFERAVARAAVFLLEEKLEPLQAKLDEWDRIDHSVYPEFNERHRALEKKVDRLKSAIQSFEALV